MAVIAGRRLHYFPAEYPGSSTRRRLEGVGGVVRLGKTADFKADSMSQARVINDVRHGRDVGLERVLIGAVAIVDKRAAGCAFNARLHPGRSIASRHPIRAARWSYSAVNVRIPLARSAILTRDELSDREGQVGGLQALQRCAVLVGELELHDRLSADRDTGDEAGDGGRRADIERRPGAGRPGRTGGARRTC